jgi:hypothetical protein
MEEVVVVMLAAGADPAEQTATRINIMYCRVADYTVAEQAVMVAAAVILLAIRQEAMAVLELFGVLAVRSHQLLPQINKE